MQIWLFLSNIRHPSNLTKKHAHDRITRTPKKHFTNKITPDRRAYIMAKRRKRHYYRPPRRKSGSNSGWIVFLIIIGLFILTPIIDPKTQGNILAHLAINIFCLILIIFSISLFIGMLPWIVALFGISLMINTSPFLGLAVIFLGIILFFWMARR